MLTLPLTAKRASSWRLLVLALLACLSWPAVAWNAAGHRLVAHIAWQQLDPPVRAEVSRLLRQHPEHARWLKRAKALESDQAAFVECSTWADEIRKDERFYDAHKEAATPTLPGYPDMERRRNWHYVFHPIGPVTQAPPQTGQLDQQLPQLSARLAASATSDAERTYLLPWLIHLVGEAHQPLHTSIRQDEAGGWDKLGAGVTVRNPFNARQAEMSLHEFWDDLPGPRWLRGDALEAASTLLQIAYPPPVAQGNSAQWIAESLTLARQRAYPDSREAVVTISDAFLAQSRDIARRRLSEAGYRLAGLLNAALKPKKRLSF